MKFLYKMRNRKSIKDFQITIDDIEKANIILFSIFGRYGDSIIGFAGSLEFIEKYPQKRYIFITSPQNYPYMYDKTKHMKNIKIMTLKKDNPFKLFYILSYLKLNQPDLGFNSFSWSMESEFLITFAKKYSFFNNHKKLVTDNFYMLMRKYLLLENEKLKVLNISNDFNKILICPDSSEGRKNLTLEQLKFIIKKYKNKSITIAVDSKKNVDRDVKQFIFNKKNSNQFLSLVKESDLMICVDSGPLHIAMLYDKEIISIFSSSSPLKVINTNKKIKIIRNKKLYNILCEFKECKQPECLNFMFYEDEEYKLDEYLEVIDNKCPLEEVK